MTQASDPFSLIYRGLWTMAEAHEALANLVTLGNRIKFSGGTTANRDPMKAETAAADLPELRLVPAGMGRSGRASSSGEGFVKRFQWQLATGEQLVDDPSGIYPVQWELLRAMHGWQSVLQALTLNTRTGWVLNCQLTEAQEGVTDTDLNRGIRGWSVVWACDVEIWLTLTDLVPAE